MSENVMPEMKLEIPIDDGAAHGGYANLAVANDGDAEFTLDFISFSLTSAPCVS